MPRDSRPQAPRGARANAPWAQTGDRGGSRKNRACFREVVLVAMKKSKAKKKLVRESGERPVQSGGLDSGCSPPSRGGHPRSRPRRASPGPSEPLLEGSTINAGGIKCVVDVRSGTWAAGQGTAPKGNHPPIRRTYSAEYRPGTGDRLPSPDFPVRLCGRCGPWRPGGPGTWSRTTAPAAGTLGGGGTTRIQERRRRWPGPSKHLGASA